MTLANGCARAAHYRHLRLEGDCELAPGVTFETCTVAGNVTAYGCAGRQLVCESGHMECRGTMQVAAINGHGRLCVGSDLLCESFAFVGDTSVNGAFVCSTSLLMIGRLLSGQRICSDAVRLIGVLEAIDLQVRSLCMEPVAQRPDGPAGYARIPFAQPCTLCGRHHGQCERIGLRRAACGAGGAVRAQPCGAAVQPQRVSG